MERNQIIRRRRAGCNLNIQGAVRKSVVWAMLVVAVASTGCALDLRLQVGRRPNNLQLIDERLAVGKSTADDVLALLGPPRGRGSAMLPIDPVKRLAWSYTYIEGSVQTGGETRGDMRSLILFVFFEQERYVGYYWFSSLPNA